MFANFAKSLEGRFSSIDERFSQVLSGSSSKVHDSRDNVSRQDLLNRSFTAPSPVAMRSEHSPDRALSASSTGDLGTTLGGRTLRVHSWGILPYPACPLQILLRLGFLNLQVVGSLIEP